MKVPVSDRDTCWYSDTSTCRHHKRDVWPHPPCFGAPEKPALQETLSGMRQPLGRHGPLGYWSHRFPLNKMHSWAKKAPAWLAHVITWHSRQAAYLLCRPCCRRRSSHGFWAHVWWRRHSGWSRCTAQQTAPICLWSGCAKSRDQWNLWEFPEKLDDEPAVEDVRAPGKINKGKKNKHVYLFRFRIYVCLRRNVSAWILLRYWADRW